MVKVVDGLFAFANAPPPFVVHPLNVWPLGAAFAVMVTGVPAVKVPLPVPFTTVKAKPAGAAVHCAYTVMFAVTIVDALNTVPDPFCAVFQLANV
jgi:hypothetical protein